MTVEPSEVEAAIAAVTAAARLTSAAQGRLADGHMLTKTDDSPVTVADFGAQAVVCAVLSAHLGDVAVVGEEHPDDLADERPELADAITGMVGDALERSVSVDQLVGWIGLGTAAAEGERYWTLDPIDGTKGFVRGDQYAIALGLVERGEVVLGVLGCPNYPADGVGLTMVAVDGAAFEIGADGLRRPLAASARKPLRAARFCESVESGHSDQSSAAQIADRLGITAAPYRIDSQCKYAAIARGDAEIYLRLPTRADYREKIWDHAAGMAVVGCAGGTVTDVDGVPLDFSHGRRLEANRGVIGTNGVDHAEVVAAVRAVIAP